MPYFNPQNQLQKATLVAIIVISSIIFVSTLITTYGGFLPTRVAAGLPFRITRVGHTSTPTLIANQENSIEWDTRPENVATYPAEVISLCPTNSIHLTPDCHILDFHTANDGSASVYVPPIIAPGTYNLVFTAWNQNDLIVFSVNNTVQVQVLDKLELTNTTKPEDTTQPPSENIPVIESSPPPTANTTAQLIILNRQPITDNTIRYSLSNISHEDIDCVSIEVNGQPAPNSGQLPSCN